jgi:hypothetical protein
MTKKSFATYFGLVVLAMSLFAATAFAANNPGPGTTQVVVTNSPAQPVPIVGAIKDADASARKPFQTAGVHVDAPNGVRFQPLITVPANQRLVIEYVSGYCDAVQGYVMLEAQSQQTETARQFLSNKDFMVTDTPASMPVRLYVNPGDEFGILTSNVGQSGYCNLALSGYFVNLP